MLNVFCFGLFMQVWFPLEILSSCHYLHFVQVIYALNTKNDENEAVTAHTEQLHEEQLSKVYEEMQMKIEHYR